VERTERIVEFRLRANAQSAEAGSRVSASLYSKAPKRIVLFTCLWSLVSKELDGQAACWFISNADLKKDAGTIGRGHVVSIEGRIYCSLQLGDGHSIESALPQLCNLDALQSGAPSPAVTRQAFDINFTRRPSLRKGIFRPPVVHYVVQSSTGDQIAYRIPAATVNRL
jgi:hypothetical protein